MPENNNAAVIAMLEKVVSTVEGMRGDISKLSIDIERISTHQKTHNTRIEKLANKQEIFDASLTNQVISMNRIEDEIKQLKQKISDFHKLEERIEEEIKSLTETQNKQEPLITEIKAERQKFKYGFIGVFFTLLGKILYDAFTK